MDVIDFPGVALVTGGASGIGRATAKLFAARGCKKLIISDVNLEGMEQVKSAIEQEHKDVNVLVVVTNVRDEASVEDLISKAICSVVFAKSYIDQYNGLFRQYHGFLINNHYLANISMDWPVFIY